ncbi:hypothetical protein EXW40_21970 [Bacillus mycoides]|nr:hypothetical protein EXW40_21970 [Bacillus mycoides]
MNRKDSILINLFSKWSLLIYHIIWVCGAFLIKLYFKSTHQNVNNLRQIRRIHFERQFVQNRFFSCYLRFDFIKKVDHFLTVLLNNRAFQMKFLPFYSYY